MKEVSALCEKIRKMAMKEKGSAESARRWKEVDHMLKELCYEKGKNVE